MFEQNHTRSVSGSFQKFTGTYWYGFNGKEKENEIAGQGNDYDFGARIYDSRMGRFLSLDVLFKEIPFQSPYVFAGNDPVRCIDKNGNFKLPTDKELEAQGLTPQEITRFRNIVDNVAKVVIDNPNALDAISKTTGFSKEKIISDMQPNQGPTISISKDGNGMNCQSGIINWPADQIKYLGGISSDDKSLLAEQTLGTVMTLLHEYGHYGDQITNAYEKDGGTVYPNTGQYSNGKFDADKPTSGSDVLKSGKQKDVGGYEYSITGHRGTDVTVLGYGVDTSLKPDNVTFSVEYPSIIPGGSKKPVSSTLPNNMQGENILNTLNVK